MSVYAQTSIITAICLLNFTLCNASWTPDSKNSVNAKFGIAGPQLNTIINPLKGVSGKAITYAPNTTGQTFLSLGYRNVGIAYTTQAPSTPEMIKNRGETKSSDFQFRLYGRRILQEYFYQTYKGQFISNSADVDPTYTSDLKIQRGDLREVNYGANYIFTLDTTAYSAAAAFGHTGRQVKSDGSVLISLSLKYQEISGDSPIIPSAFQSVYSPDSTITKATFSTISPGLGYGHTFVYSDWYATIQLLFGGTLEQRNVVSSIPIENKGKNSSTGILKMGLGYNGKQNYFGIQLLQDSVEHQFEKSSFTMSATVFSMFYGHRFEGVSIKLLDPISDFLD